MLWPCFSLQSILGGHSDKSGLLVLLGTVGLLGKKRKGH